MKKPLSCSTRGCRGKVPPHEWPLDRREPVFCDACLRANQTRPSIKATK